MYKNFLTDLQFFSAQAPCIQQLLCSHSFPENVLGAGDLTMKKTNNSALVQLLFYCR